MVIRIGILDSDDECEENDSQLMEEIATYDDKYVQWCPHEEISRKWCSREKKPDHSRHGSVKAQEQKDAKGILGKSRVMRHLCAKLVSTCKVR